MTDQLSQSGWPEDAEEVRGDADQPSVWKPVLLYGLPFLILFVFPAVAWIALLPGAVGVRWTTHPPHRRRLVWIYLVTGMISLAPWIALIARGDVAELVG
ncbi:MAG TPA: hypothetical protein VES03_06110 [Motilibacterales bacterium]|jgi:hypothetical protein|nr:hypothetical protein [Motilibacterales bacterium]